jgi:hypothetical protein
VIASGVFCVVLGVPRVVLGGVVCPGRIVFFLILGAHAAVAGGVSGPPVLSLLKCAIVER